MWVIVILYIYYVVREYIWYDERCVFDEYLVFVYILKVNSVNFFWGIWYNVNSKFWCFFGVFLVIVCVLECVLCFDFEDY